MTSEELCEAIAAQCHESWSHWMRYLFSKGYDIHDQFVLPSDVVERWQRQMDTPYTELSEQEKDSDRAEVLRFLPIIEAWTTGWIEQTTRTVQRKLEELL